MNILITGGAGFIGSHVADAYVAAGHRVSILDNFSGGSPENVNPAVTVYNADIRDREAVRRVFRQDAFDLLNHHAAQLDVRVSVADPQFDAEQNIIGSLNLLQAAVETGVGRVIFASSGGTVYGEPEYYPADERHPTHPISPYGVSKLSVENYLYYYGYIHGVKAIVLRYTNVYGPRQNPHGEAGVVSIFCNMMLRGEEPVIYGDGEQTRDYVYVGDVARGNLLAAGHLEQGKTGTFNICVETETTVNRLFTLLNARFGDRFRERHGPTRPGEQLRSVCSFAKAHRELGWQPQVALDDGLGETLEWFRARFERQA